MRQSGGHTVDPLADTLRIDLFGDTQPIGLVGRSELFDADDARWFDEGERNAAEEWLAMGERRAATCRKMSFALAFAGSAMLGILAAVVL